VKWLLFTVLGAAMVAAVVFRRALADPESDFAKWFEARARPKLKDLVTLVFLATFLLWAAVYVTAPNEARDDLGEAMKTLWDSIGGEKTDKPETR